MGIVAIESTREQLRFYQRRSEGIIAVAVPNIIRAPAKQSSVTGPLAIVKCVVKVCVCVVLFVVVSWPNAAPVGAVIVQAVVAVAVAVVVVDLVVLMWCCYMIVVEGGCWKEWNGNVLS